MEFFLEQIELILPVLSFNVLRPVPKSKQLQAAPASEASDVSPIFEMSPVGTHALGREVHGEFFVLQGSTARNGAVDSWTSYHALRDQLVNEHRLVPDSDSRFLRFVEDVAFKSPSAAAAVVYAGNQNGPLTWKIQGTNTTYRQWKEAKIRHAEESV